MKKLNFLFSLFLFTCLTALGQGYVATVPPLAGGNGSSGVTFNVTTSQTINIDTLFCTFTGTGVTEIWYNPTPINGTPNVSTANGWILLGNNIPITTSTTLGNVVPIPFNINLTMPAGSTHGFYVAGSGISGGAALAYTNGTTGQSHPYTDGIVTIECGNNVGYGGGPGTNMTLHIRQFNGGLSYRILGGTNDAAVLSVDSPSVFCAGNHNVVATIGNYGANQLDSVDVNWEFNGVAQPSFTYVGFLDTLNGTFPTTAQVLLGNMSFPSGSNNIIKVWTSNPNGVADTSNYNDTISVTRGPALSGTFTVNPALPASATNFQTMGAMTNTFNNNGICGPVLVNVAPGVYNEAVEFGSINGASSVNTVTVDGGDSSQTFIVHNGSGNNATVTINGTNWLTFKNFGIIGNGTTGSAVILTGAVENCTVSNNAMRVSVTSTSSASTVLSFSGSATSPTTTPSAQFRYNTIANNLMRGGYYGIRMYGNSGLQDPGNKILNNDIDSVYYYGIYAGYIDSAEIIGNRVIQSNRPNINGDGIYFLYSNNSKVNSNYILADDYGFYWTNSSTATSSLQGRNEVINNMIISNGDFANYIYSVDAMNYYHNSLLALGANSPALYIAGSTTYPMTGWDMRNNSFAASGGYAVDMATYNTSIFTTMDHNNYYTSGTSIFDNNGTVYGNLAALQTGTSPLNANSISGDPIYISTTDLHAGGSTLNDNGDNSVGVLVDIDGQTRPSSMATTVDIGADEFDVAPYDAGVSNVISPSGNICPGAVTPVVEIFNFGSATIDSVKVYWDVNGTLDSTTYIGSIAAGTSANATLGTVNVVAGQIYNVTFYTGLINNGQLDQDNSNNSLTINGLQTGMVGNFTLNPALPASATNFIDFASLSTAIGNAGVCGSVVVNVAPGVYTGAVQFNDIPGASATNTLTIDGGDSTTTFLLHNGSGNNATLTINGSSWLTVKNFNIQATGTTGSAVILTNGPTHCTISNNEMRTSVTSTSSAASILSFSGSITSPTTTPALSFSYNVIENNLMRGGYYGIRMYGNSGNHDPGNKILNNDMDSIYYYGIYAGYIDSAEIIGNRVIQSNRSNVNGDGIYFLYANNSKVNSNYVLADDYGFYWTNSSTATSNLTSNNEVINNMIISNGDFAVYLYSVDTVNFWHNSLLSLGTSPALYIAGSTTYPINGYDMRNNIFSAGGGSSALRMLTYGAAIFNKMDNNDYYTTGGTLIEELGTSYASLAAFQAAFPLLNTASIEGDPQYLSNTDLHITGTFVNDSGDASVPVVVDIDGETRPATGAFSVDMGADEFDPPACPPAFNLATLNPGLDSVTLVWDATGVGVTYEYEIVLGGAAQGSGTPVITGMDSIRVGGLTASTRYDFYVRVICGRGDSSLWMGPLTFNTANGIPYFQDFQNWTNPNLTGLINEEGWYTLGTPVPNWQVNSTTSSSATGPIGDHTIGSGGTFVYLETSGGTTGDDDTLWSAPIFVAANQNAIEFEFWYHMHGATMGTLDVFVQNLAGLNLITSISGQQQAVQTDPWLSFDTLLTGYAGQSIQLVFVGTRGSSFTGDMAIDDVSLDLAPAQDIAVVAMPTPIDDSLQCYTSTEAVSLEIINAGLNALDFAVDTADITMNISGAVTATLTYQLNNNSLNSGNPLVSGNSITIPMGTIDMTGLGAYTFSTVVVMNNDGDLSNNTLTETITVLAQSGGVVSGTDTICAGDTADLSTSGYYGTIQWQEYDGTTWNNIPGATGPAIQVAPSVNTDYRVIACGSGTSNVLTVVPLNIPAPSVINRITSVACNTQGTDTLIAQSTIMGASFNWYDSAVGGTNIHSGDTLLFTGTPSGTTMPAIDTFWVAANTGNTGDTAIPAPHASIYSGNARGYHFVAPIDFTITGLEVPQSANPGQAQNVAVLQTVGNVPWNLWNAAIVPFTTLHLTQNGPVNGYIPVNIKVKAGDVIALLGQRGTGGSYSTDNDIVIDGNIVPIQRFIMQNPLGTTAPASATNLGYEASSSIARVSFTYAVGCEGPRTMVIGEVDCLVGLEDFEAVETFELYPNPSNGVFNLKISTLKAEQLNLTVRDVNGKAILNKVVNVNGTYQDVLDFEGYAKGIYYLHIQNNDAIKVENIVIQ